jgi:hypothetical protein
MTPLTLVLLTLAGLFAIAVTARFLMAPLDRYDEGVTVIKGALMAQGLVPYRDFWMTYGPLDAGILAAAFHVIAVDVLVERVVAILTALLFTGIAYLLVTAVGARGALRLLMTGLMALVPVSIPMFNSAVLADLLALASFAAFVRGEKDPRPRWPLLAGVGTGLATFARPELGIALALGLLIGYAAPAIVDRRRRPLVAYAGVTGAVVALSWGAMLLVSGPGPVVLDLIVYAVRLYPSARGVPLGQGAEGPAVLVMAGAFVVIWLWAMVVLVQHRFAPPERDRILALLVTGMLLFMWVRTRADGWHAMIAWPATGVLLTVLMQRRQRSRASIPRLEAVMSVAAMLSVIFATGALAARDLARPSTDALVAHATLVGSRAWMPSDQLAALIARIDQAVPPGQSFLVGLQRNDLVSFNDTMVYALAGRRPGTVYFEDLPGFSNADAVERTVICQLTRSRVTLAVLGPNTPGEPSNLSSHLGSHRLDAWLTQHTVDQDAIGPYLILTLRPDPYPAAPCPEPGF